MSLQDVFGGGFDVAANYVEESEGQALLPDIAGAVLMIPETPEIISNDAGWQGLKFKFLIVNDGAYNGQYNGQERTYNITIANPNHEDSAKWGREELARLSNACGIQVLNQEADFFQKQFSADIGRKVNKKKTQEAKSGNPNAEPAYDQTYRKLKPLGLTQPPQQQAAPQQMAAPQAAPMQQAPAPQQAAPQNPFIQQ